LQTQIRCGGRTNDIEDGSNVALARAEIDDARPQPESAANDGARDENATAQLNVLQNSSVHCIQGLLIKIVISRNVSETDDA
jgi:hypothetical protein